MAVKRGVDVILIVFVVIVAASCRRLLVLMGRPAVVVVRLAVFVVGLGSDGGLSRTNVACDGVTDGA